MVDGDSPWARLRSRGYPRAVGLSDEARISPSLPTRHQSYPVERSEVLVGTSDATLGYPVGRSDGELLVRFY
jgi:hypothetical protein